MDRRSLYHEDIYAWAAEQAALLRRAAAGPGVLPDGLDLENLAEEIGDVGKSELRATSSYLRQVFIHLLKIALEPRADARDHWEGEIVQFLLDARDAYSPSMRRMIDLDAVWDAALRICTAKLAAHLGRLPARCPFTLDELLRADFDVDAALARLSAA